MAASALTGATMTAITLTGATMAASTPMGATMAASTPRGATAAVESQDKMTRVRSAAPLDNPLLPSPHIREIQHGQNMNPS